jgi:Ran-interacting Mog1 protein
MRAVVPQGFADISTLRQVPDNQEVFAQAETDRSLLFELVEAETDGVPSLPGGDAPARFHWQVLARDSDAVESTITHSAYVPLDQLSPSISAGDSNAHVSIVHGTQRVAKFKDSADKANDVCIALACIRLPRVNTDVLIVFNDPVAFHPGGSSSKVGASVSEPGIDDPKQRASILQAALYSLSVEDWSLFG